MSAQIRRYSVEPWDIRRADMKPDECGDYVRYDDHSNLLTAMTAERDALADQVSKLEGEVSTARSNAFRKAHRICMRNAFFKWHEGLKFFYIKSTVAAEIYALSDKGATND